MHEYIFEVSKDAEQLFSIRNGFRTRIIRCKDCKKRLPKGWCFDKYCNKAEQDACNLFSSHDFDWDYTHFFYVEPDDFCKWGEAK